MNMPDATRSPYPTHHHDAYDYGTGPWAQSNTLRYMAAFEYDWAMRRVMRAERRVVLYRNAMVFLFGLALVLSALLIVKAVTP